MSDFDRMASAFASPLLMQQFGERDANGAFGGVRYWPPAANAGEPGSPWTASVGPLETQDAPDEGGGSHQFNEQREYVTLQGINPESPFLKNGYFEVARYPGERFRIDSINRGGVMTTVRAYRCLTEASQRRGFERGR